MGHNPETIHGSSDYVVRGAGLTGMHAHVAVSTGYKQAGPIILQERSGQVHVRVAGSGCKAHLWDKRLGLQAESDGGLSLVLSCTVRLVEKGNTFNLRLKLCAIYNSVY